MIIKNFGSRVLLPAFKQMSELPPSALTAFGPQIQSNVFNRPYSTSPGTKIPSTGTSELELKRKKLEILKLELDIAEIEGSALGGSANQPQPKITKKEQAPPAAIPKGDLIRTFIEEEAASVRETTFEAASSLAKGAASVGGTTFKAASSFAEGAASSASSFTESAANTASSFTESAANTASSFAEGAASTASSFAESAASTASSFAESAASTASSFAESAASVGEAMIDNAQITALVVAGFLGIYVLSTVMNNDTFKNSIENVKGVGTSISNTVGNAVDAVGNAVDTIKGVGNSISTTAGNAVDAIKGVGGIFTGKKEEQKKETEKK